MSLPQGFLNILCCPKRLCRGDLAERPDGMLFCGVCKAEYRVIDGIPMLFPNPEYSPDVHQRHWDLERNAKSYAKKYDTYLKKQGAPWGVYTHVSELEGIKKLTNGINLAGKTILDLGCGNGRLLSVYPEAGVKIGLDASLHLLQATKNREPDFWLVCAQVEDLPFKDAVCDLSVSIRVLQHLKTPEHAFAEMARVTKPSGYVALEVYNKLNLKELYKRLRMTKWMKKWKPWGLDYDRYYSYLEIEKWCEQVFVKPVKYVGAGWGSPRFWLIDFLKFRSWPDAMQKAVLAGFFWLENILGPLPFFSKTMEKLCFIGSVQALALKKSLIKKISDKIKIRKDLRKALSFEEKLKIRNYSLAGNDLQHLRLSVDWLKNAQDATPDGGVSRGFSLVRNGKSNESGWQPSYPETTGYIIPTMIDASRVLNDKDLIRRAKLMADWELNIMFPDGSVLGGHLGTRPHPVVFNTGQVIRGLHALYKETKEKRYLEGALRSADWILKNEHNKDGKWTEFYSGSVDKNALTHNIYAAAPVISLGVETGNEEFKKMGERAGNFTVSMQNSNGWFRNCDFGNKNDTLLHPLAYATDGLWDAGDMLNNQKFLSAAKKALDGIFSQMDERGFIPGRLDENWKGTVEWACLTGIAQVGVTAMKVYRKYGDGKYLEKALKAKEFLKSCQNNFDPNYGGGLGAMWGSWPISGEYGKFQALNWPAKYFADLLMDLIFHERGK